MNGNFRRFIPAVLLLFIFVGGMGWQLGKAKRPAPVTISASIPFVVTPTPTVPVAKPITLESIFSPDHAWIHALPQEKIVTMIATGDVIPARSVNYKMATGHGFLWPWKKTADVLRSADTTVINLETPLLSSCPLTVEGMLFCGDARAVEGLRYAGVDVATLGNNHIGNHFAAGIEETIRHLRTAGITPVSQGVVYKEIKGIRFAFLAYNDIGAPEAGVPWADDETIRTEVARARNTADVVLVAYHWGAEYVAQPGERQRYLARLAVDAGADVVLGNHPHWIQPVEIYKGKFIAYAHGNFVFDQEWSEETKRGMIGRYVFYDKKLVDVEYLPVRIVDYGQPYFLEGQEKQKILDSLRTASTQLLSK